MMVFRFVFEGVEDGVSVSVVGWVCALGVCVFAAVSGVFRS